MLIASIEQAEQTGHADLESHLAPANAGHLRVVYDVIAGRRMGQWVHTR